MSFTNCLAKMQTLTVNEMFTQLISQDDAPVMIQLLCVLRKIMAAGVLSQTIASMVNGNADADAEQTNVESVVLVLAAKHGATNIVEAVVTDDNSKISSLIVDKAKSEAHKNNHAAIVERLTQSVDGIGTFTVTSYPTTMPCFHNNNQ